MSEERKGRRSGIQIMARLIGLVRPLLHIMAGAIFLGVLGYLCAIFLTILAGQGILKGLGENTFLDRFTAGKLFFLMGILAVFRGLLHYAEQYCNHFIAFKLLAIIRHKVFAALRKLCPAKLEGRDKGNLISIITTDIELLEVFYAHTISPVAIAFLTSLIMVVFIGSYHVLAGLFALAAYVVVGALIPLWNGKRGGSRGMEFRTGFGELNSFVLDSLRGLDETIQYGQGEKRMKEMEERSVKLGNLQKNLSRLEGSQRSFTTLAILAFSFGILFFNLYLGRQGELDFGGILTCTIAMMGSFGPVTALSSLSNNLNQTLASGERVLSILEEKPLVEEIPVQEDAPDFIFTGAQAEHVTFAYEKEVILKDYSLEMPKGKIIGIHGASGSGKSTLLKLLMRFWDVEQGTVKLSRKDVRQIPTAQLRDTESYVTQETHLFHDSIANNIAIGKPGASREEIIEAAKKASVHEFIMTLPKGYDTEVGELGDTLSGGEKQRVAVARALINNPSVVLADEPSGSLDTKNKEELHNLFFELRDKLGQTFVIVTHDEGLASQTDRTIHMLDGRIV